MAGYTPPKIEDAPKSFIGVGTRELVIAAAGVILAVLVYLSDMFAPLKIGLAIICAGIGVGIAFGRDPKTGRKFEEMIAQILMFYGRDKFHQKGIDHVEKYDYNEGSEIYKPGIAGYNTKFVHSGWRSLHTLKDSKVDPEFLVSYEDRLLVGYEYEISFWMTTDEEGTSGKIYFEHANYGDVNDEIVGYEEALTFTGLKAGEWKQYKVKIVANAPYLVVRVEKGTSLFFEDFEAIPTGAKGELGNLLGYNPNAVGGEPGAGLAPWVVAIVIGGGVVVLGGGAAAGIFFLRRKKA